ncbi:MAG: GNAT family N-acetyltransferase [Deltaproteobacteria bacterium]|nr:GNAT family N-acetyltransferase [Deltaproteobacteria bacterium]
MVHKVKDFSITTNFDCGDLDLNEFFQTDAANYRSELLAETYTLYLKGYRKLGPLAFVALANDVIKLSKPQKRKFIHHQKRYLKEYPGVKIARLGVDKQYQRFGVGTQFLNLLKAFFTTDNRTGCRFMTVDAYNDEKAPIFYEKNEFDFLHDKDASDRTRIMFYDLKRFVAT